MKVLLLNGSPRKEGCTFTALSEVAKTLNHNGIDTEIFQAGNPDTDNVKAAAAKLKEADALIVGSPVYWASPSGQIIEFMDKLCSMAGKDMLLQLLLGAHGGVLGETCAVALILGGIYLIATKTISAAIPLSYIGTVAVLSLVLGQDVVLQLFSGGLLLGAFFMATDYVTSPFTFTGRIVYGVCLGVITCIIRFYGNMAEGVSFALLLMNLLVPYINDLTRQKPLGGAKAK